ncbi:uncharacterized protein PRCAT00005754001 [Priceomyces carsonii]|uniref:uncharacterized protein n=1 Tax=Priceomyces carsonii TaxID=28549 RepID=UPI002EDAD525|nr:unnamed protein product [Priceomyces carsonii]
MTSIQLLTIGSNPNLVFYAWRLQETKSVEVTVVNPSVNFSGGVNFDSSISGKINFKPQSSSQSLETVARTTKYDIVILSCVSLQEFQTLCNDLKEYISDDTLFVVESTGYVNLEPFIQHSYPKAKNLKVCAIMNEFDVRQLDEKTFQQRTRSNDSRIYFGTSLKSSNIAKASNFQRMYKLLQLVHEDSSEKISLLKSVNTKEFMTYQWKLALPRIVFNPLSIIFETEFPESLSSQILCKPLMTGIINELFKIIKKMDCKLVKGYENETNLLKNWSKCYPKTTNSDSYIDSPQLFYDFYMQHEVEVDLLLLQPILLADDHGIRTPYLENIYSTMSQLLKINSAESKSIFFERKPRGIDRDQIKNTYEMKLNQISIMDSDLAKKQSEKQQLEEYLNEKKYSKTQLEDEISRMRVGLNNLNLNMEKGRLDYEAQMKRNEDAQLQHERLLYEAQAISNGNGSKNVNEVQNDIATLYNGVKQRDVRSSVVPGDDLHDLADIALYGDTLNGQQVIAENEDGSKMGHNNNFGNQPPQNFQGHNHQPSYSNGHANANGDFSQQLREKELELQRREQALYNKESMQGQEGAAYGSESLQSGYFDASQYQKGSKGYPPQIQPHYQPQGVNGYYQNGIGPSPIEQQPPHGLPSGGLPLNGLPLNLRGQRMQPMNYQPRRQSSFPSIYHLDSHGHGYGQQQYHSASFQNAAPIDPLVEQRFRANPKKLNRRSAFPQMNGNMDGLDMGGRGGMPMPGSQGKHKNGKVRPSVTSSVTSPVLLQKKDPTPPGNVSQYPQQFLQPPAVQGSNESSNSSSNSATSGDTPVTDHANEAAETQQESIQINVPITENYKPLGNISEANKDGEKQKKKKKKGLFSRK